MRTIKCAFFIFHDIYIGNNFYILKIFCIFAIVKFKHSKLCILNILKQ